jgi:hypothetical protein
MERMEKQTAVEWQFEQLFNSFEKFNNGECTFNDFLKRNLEIRKQAKEMDKQKLEQFYNHGQWAVVENGHGECFEDYYNRTFKSE